MKKLYYLIYIIDENNIEAELLAVNEDRMESERCFDKALVDFMMQPECDICYLRHLKIELEYDELNDLLAASEAGDSNYVLELLNDINGRDEGVQLDMWCGDDAGESFLNWYLEDTGREKYFEHDEEDDCYMDFMDHLMDDLGPDKYKKLVTRFVKDIV